MRSIQAGIFFLLIVMASTLSASEDGIFKDFQGVPRSVDSFMGDGKWLVMMIWASNCPICNQEAESYARLHGEAENIRVLGLSIDGEADLTSAQDFVERHDLPFPNLISDPADLMLFYQEQTVSRFAGTPTFLVYNPDGELMAAQAGGVPSKVIKQFIAGKTQSTGS